MVSLGCLVLGENHIFYGETKYSNKSLLKGAEKRTGEKHWSFNKTKETNDSIKSAADKKRGRTKETHEGILSRSNKITGRTKETHEYLRLNGEKRKGLTKENCDYLMRMSQTLTGRTKETHHGIASQAEKLSKVPKEIRKFIVDKFSNGEKRKDIKNWLKEYFNINISESTITRIYQANAETPKNRKQLLSEELKQEIVNKYDIEKKSFVEINNWLKTLNINICLSAVRSNYHRIKNLQNKEKVSQ